MAWPAHGEAVIHSLAETTATSQVDSVTLLGSGAKLKFEQRADGLHIHLPADAPGKYAYAYRITFK
jgi:alpha-L-fucosidase